MQIQLGYELVFETAAPTAMTVMLFVHPSRQHELLQPDTLYTEPNVPVDQYFDSFSNRCARLVTAVGRTRLWSSNVIETTEEPDEADFDAPQHPVEELPPETLQFLLGSRYCEVDLLSQAAW